MRRHGPGISGSGLVLATGRRVRQAIGCHHDHAHPRQAPHPPADQLAGAQAPDRLFLPGPGRALHARDRGGADHPRDQDEPLCRRAVQAAGLPLHRARQLHPPGSGPGVLADAVEFGGLGVRLGDPAIRLRICRRAAAAAGLSRPRAGAHADAAAVDHPGRRGRADLGVALSAELRRHQRPPDPRGLDARAPRLAVVAGHRDGGGGLHQCLARHSVLRHHAAGGAAVGAGRAL